jgi:hypothetical protein
MKKLITLILLFSAWNSFGQLKLMKETDKKLEPIMLTNGDWVLVSENSVNNKLKSLIFYKSDLSVYKTVNIPQVFPHDTVKCDLNEIFLSNVDIIGDNSGKDFIYTDKFFNDDSKIEILLKYQSRKVGDFSKETILIINEDSQEIERFSSPLNGYVNISYWKYLNVEIGVYSQQNGSTKMYSIPGNLPCPSSCSQKSAAIAPISPANEFKEIQVNGFPNPSSDKVTLAYALPEGVSFGTLKLYTQTGELVKEFKVSSQMDHLELPVSDYTPGTYYYELQAGGNTSGGKKMVVIH